MLIFEFGLWAREDFLNVYTKVDLPEEDRRKQNVNLDAGHIYFSQHIRVP